jgi:hypothetical protein
MDRTPALSHANLAAVLARIPELDDVRGVSYEELATLILNGLEERSATEILSEVLAASAAVDSLEGDRGNLELGMHPAALMTLVRWWPGTGLHPIPTGQVETLFGVRITVDTDALPEGYWAIRDRAANTEVCRGEVIRWRTR